ncbi:MAG: helicase C-terminal domain-containing protein [Candidatus Parvarchaeota archaeon]
MIFKTPCPDLGDPWMRAHYDRLKDWFDIQTLQELLQTAGRIVRSGTDWGTTYVIDRNSYNLIKRHTDKLPNWFLERLTL